MSLKIIKPILESKVVLLKHEAVWSHINLKGYSVSSAGQEISIAPGSFSNIMKTKPCFKSVDVFVSGLELNMDYDDNNPRSEQYIPYTQKKVLPFAEFAKQILGYAKAKSSSPSYKQFKDEILANTRKSVKPNSLESKDQLFPEKMRIDSAIVMAWVRFCDDISQKGHPLSYLMKSVAKKPEKSGSKVKKSALRDRYTYTPKGKHCLIYGYIVSVVQGGAKIRLNNVNHNYVLDLKEQFNEDGQLLFAVTLYKKVNSTLQKVSQTAKLSRNDFARACYHYIVGGGYVKENPLYFGVVGKLSGQEEDSRDFLYDLKGEVVKFNDPEMVLAAFVYADTLMPQKVKQVAAVA